MLNWIKKHRELATLIVAITGIIDTVAGHSLSFSSLPSSVLEVTTYSAPRTKRTVQSCDH